MRGTLAASGFAEVARRLHEQFPQAVDLRFSLYYRKPDRICSTLEEHFAAS